MGVVLLSRDLMLLSRTQGAANKCGATLTNCGDVAQAVAELENTDCRSVIIDLRLPGLRIGEAVSQLRTAKPSVTIAACGPHVHEASLQAAREALCDIIATRGQFDRDADAIVAQLIAETSA